MGNTHSFPAIHNKMIPITVRTQPFLSFLLWLLSSWEILIPIGLYSTILISIVPSELIISILIVVEKWIPSTNESFLTKDAISCLVVPLSKHTNSLSNWSNKEKTLFIDGKGSIAIICAFTFEKEPFKPYRKQMTRFDSCFFLIIPARLHR